MMVVAGVRAFPSFSAIEPGFESPYRRRAI